GAGGGRFPAVATAAGGAWLPRTSGHRTRTGANGPRRRGAGARLPEAAAGFCAELLKVLCRKGLGAASRPTITAIVHGRPAMVQSSSAEERNPRLAALSGRSEPPMDKTRLGRGLD